MRGASAFTLSLWVSALAFATSVGQDIVFSYLMNANTFGVPAPSYYVNVGFDTDGGLALMLFPAGASAPLPLATNRWYQLVLALDGAETNPDKPVSSLSERPK